MCRAHISSYDQSEFEGHFVAARDLRGKARVVVKAPPRGVDLAQSARLPDNNSGTIRAAPELESPAREFARQLDEDERMAQTLQDGENERAILHEDDTEEEVAEEEEAEEDDQDEDDTDGEEESDAVADQDDEEALISRGEEPPLRSFEEDDDEDANFPIMVERRWWERMSPIEDEEAEEEEDGEQEDENASFPILVERPGWRRRSPNDVAAVIQWRQQYVHNIEVRRDEYQRYVERLHRAEVERQRRAIEEQCQAEEMWQRPAEAQRNAVQQRQLEEQRRMAQLRRYCLHALERQPPPSGRRGGLQRSVGSSTDRGGVYLVAQQRSNALEDPRGSESRWQNEVQLVDGEEDSGAGEECDATGNERVQLAHGGARKRSSRFLRHSSTSELDQCRSVVRRSSNVHLAQGGSRRRSSRLVLRHSSTPEMEDEGGTRSSRKRGHRPRRSWVARSTTTRAEGYGISTIRPT